MAEEGLGKIVEYMKTHISDCGAAAVELLATLAGAIEEAEEKLKGAGAVDGASPRMSATRSGDEPPGRRCATRSLTAPVCTCVSHATRCCLRSHLVQ